MTETSNIDVNTLDSESLHYLIDKGIINYANVQQIIEMKEKQELLNSHPYDKWQGKNGLWYVYIPDETAKQGRRLVRRNTEKGIDNVIIAYQKTQLENPTVKELFNEWNEAQKNNGFIKDNTYARNIKCFNRHLTEWENRRIKSISDEMWIDFLEAQIVKFNMTYKGFSGIKHIVEGIILKARRKHCISFTADDVIKNLMIPKNAYRKSKPKDEDEAYTDAEMLKILDYTTQHRDAPNDCITLIFGTGMRVGEAVALKHDDLNIENLSISVNKTESRLTDDKGKVHLFVQESTKTEAGTRIVHLPRKHKQLLANLWWNSANTEYVFMNKGKRMITNTVRNRLRKICKELGIKYKSPHKIRKTVASIMLENNVDESMIKSELGHTMISTTKNYYSKCRKTDSEIVDELSRVMGE